MRVTALLSVTHWKIRSTGSPVSCVVLHLQEHRLHVGQSQLLFPWRPVLPKGMQLSGCDSIGLDGILFRKESAEVFEKAASNYGRRFERFAHLSRSFARTNKNGRAAKSSVGSSLGSPFLFLSS
jgi:hypothetical protein